VLPRREPVDLVERVALTSHSFSTTVRDVSFLSITANAGPVGPLRPSTAIAPNATSQKAPSAARSAPPAMELERIKWLWHGNVFRALQTVHNLEIDLDADEPGGSQAKSLKAVREFSGYIAANTGRIRNYGERRRATISTACLESAVNQVISKHIVKNSRCDGHPAAPTSCSKSAPESSTTNFPATSTAGTPDSLTPRPTGRNPRVASPLCPALMRDRQVPHAHDPALSIKDQQHHPKRSLTFGRRIHAEKALHTICRSSAAIHVILATMG
jgi:hypothetical protein